MDVFYGSAVLFNTVAYAQFLAIVFSVAWVLVDRRFSLVLPWLGLAAYTVAHPSPSAVLLTALGAGLSAGLVLMARRGARQVADSIDFGAAPPSARLALTAFVLAMIALGFLTYRDQGADPFSVALQALGVPATGPFSETLANTALAPYLLPVSRFVGLLLPYLLALGTYLLLVARKVRLLFILAASYVFYAHWDYRFLPLIWASSTADWWLGNAIARASNERSRRMWLISTVIMNLGVLGFFKYFNFGIDTANATLESIGLEPLSVALRVALPVGISFFTFESMSYVIDVYRGELKPQKSYVEYLSFVAFFPHLVAGPIVRPRDLLPQLAGPARFSAAEASEGLFLVAVGLSKKILVGDYLALNLVDRVFDAPTMYSGLEVYAGVLGYALQIYCDFSGYTDIAIGSALLLGVRFPLNFDSPYKSQSITEFWRRWHISLSTWLRDYLYIPLGGNRKGRGRTYFNLLATMILGGLWHGAAWTFVAWGTLHGVALALNKWWHETFASDARRGARREAGEAVTEPAAMRRPLWRLLSVLLTFHFVCACWVFFRAESFSKAWLVFAQMGTFTFHHPNLPLSVAAVLALGLVGHFVPDRLFGWAQRSFTQLPAVAQGVLLFAVALLLRKMASTDAVPFVYFQF